MPKHSIRAALVLFLAFGNVGTALPETVTNPKAPKPRVVDPDDDRFEPYAFIGEVNNRFAASGRVVDRQRDDEEQKFIDHVAGFGFEYRLLGKHNSTWQLVLSGQTIHTARTVVVDTAAALPSQQEFLTVLRDGDVLETLASARIRKTIHWYARGTNGGADTVAATAIYLKGQGGFIRTDVRDDDVLDNHFVGIGVEHLIGPYADSFLEAGIGRSELFERSHRDERFKVGASLNYTPGAKAEDEDAGLPFGLFTELWLDSDLGPASDDVQLYLGLFFDVDRILRMYGQ